MTQRDISDFIVERLQMAGVDVVFTLCGNHILPLYRALVDAGVRLVDLRTEASAVMAADAYSRVGRRLGVALVTGGPGFTNALTGVATANAAGSSVLVLAGATATHLQGRGALQEMRQAAVAEPLCRYSTTICEEREVAGKLDEALRAATVSPRGTACVSLPTDLLTRPAASTVRGPEPEPAAEPVPNEVLQEIAERVQRAKRPSIILGTAAYWAGVEDDIERLGENSGIPVFTIDLARGMVSDDHEWCYGYADASISRAAALLATSDVVLLIGKEIDFRLRFGQAFSPDAFVAQVLDHDPIWDPVQAASLTAVGDLREFCTGLAELEWPRRSPFEDWLVELGLALPIASEQEPNSTEGPVAGGLLPQDVATIVARVVRNTGATVVLDAGDFVQWCRAIVPALGPGRWVRLGPMATCGAGLPFALGAKVAAPDRRILLVIGDGSFGYYCADLEAANRQGIPITAVVGNNNSWGLEEELQRGLYGPDYIVASELGDVRYADVATSFGARGSHVTTLTDLERELIHAMDQGELSCLEVPLAKRPSALTEAVIGRGGEV